MKRLAVLVAALALACTPAPSDPNEKNAVYAQALCTQDADTGFAAMGTNLRSEIEFYAGLYEMTPEDYFAMLFAAPEGFVCEEARYVGSYVDSYGQHASIYIFTINDGEQTYGLYFVFVSDETGVEGVE